MADGKVTIYDIATRAGVSVSTVSRVLNRTAAVAKIKRDRVLSVIREMDYQPNAMARGLTSNRSSTIGVIIPDLLNPYYASFVFEVEREAMTRGYSVLLCNTMDTYLPGSRKIEMGYMRMLADKRVDGAILTGGSLEAVSPGEEFAGELKRMKEHLPIVLVSESYRADEISTVCCDKPAGIQSMVRHLAAVGHRSMGIVAGRADIGQSTQCVQAFHDTARELGIETRPEWIVGNNYTFESGASAGARIAAAGERPSALVCINDIVALGAMYACQAANLKIPDDIAIAGCDNIEWSMYAYPRLTTIDLHTPLVARHAVDSLLRTLSGGKPDPMMVIKPDLVIRESSAYVPRV